MHQSLEKFEILTYYYTFNVASKLTYLEDDTITTDRVWSIAWMDHVVSDASRTEAEKER